MSIVLPDPRLEHPNLLIPGRKPTVPVEIDRNHWAAPSLCYVDRSLKDLAGNNHGSITGSISYDGDHWDFPNSTSAYIEFDSMPFSGAEARTELFVFRTGSTADQTLVRVGGTSSGEMHLVALENSVIAFRIWGGYRTFTAPTYADNKWHALLLTSNGNSNTANAWFDGSSLGVNATLDRALNTTSSSPNDVLGLDTNGPLNPMNGGLGLYAAWRGLYAPDAFAENVTGNPYQFLIPR